MLINELTVFMNKINISCEMTLFTFSRFLKAEVIMIVYNWVIIIIYLFCIPKKKITNSVCMNFQKRKRYRGMVYEMWPLALARQISHLFYSKNVQMTKIPKMLEMTVWWKQEGKTR